MTDQSGFWWYLVGLHPGCLFLPTRVRVLSGFWLCVCEGAKYYTVHCTIISRSVELEPGHWSLAVRGKSMAA